MSIGVLGGLISWTVIWVSGLIYLAVRRRGRRPVLPLLCVAGATAIAVTLILYFALPKVDVQPLPSLWSAEEAIGSAGRAGALNGSTAGEVRRALRSHLRRTAFRNELTGDLMKIEDSPGNLEVIEDERGIVVRSFDMRGFPRDDAPVSDVLTVLERGGYW